MPLTLLFDLDDTLLGNDIDRFLPAYLKALAKHLANHVHPEKMVQELLAATRKMIANNDPAVTLEQAFDAAFYPAIGRSKEDLFETLHDFYDNVYPALQATTSSRPAAPSVIRDLIAAGHSVAVATNPLFPLKAIDHRLRWAGLDPEHVPFNLRTSYEHYHFAKPNPAFYAEVLAQLGWPNQPAVMIGNSLEDDLLPAAELGLPGYWIGDGDAPLPDGLHPLSAAGALEDVPAWVEKIAAAGQGRTVKTPAGLSAILKSSPAALDTLSRSLTEKHWLQRPEPAEWSVTEILCHLRDVDLEINIPRVQKVIRGENPFLPGINSDTWTDERSYCKQDGHSALQAFREARGALVGCLESLAPAVWQFPARHAIFGPTNLRELVDFMTTHDQSHIRQILSAYRQVGE